MITDKINQIQELITVPNVDNDPEGSLNAMKILNLLSELRGLVDYDSSPLVRISLDDFPENLPLYKDSGLWQLREDDMEDVIFKQDINESDFEFIERCKAINEF